MPLSDPENEVFPFRGSPPSKHCSPLLFILTVMQMCRHFVFSKKPLIDAQTPCTTQLFGGQLSSQVEGIKMETAECDAHADVRPTPETLKTCEHHNQRLAFI